MDSGGGREDSIDAKQTDVSPSLFTNSQLIDLNLEGDLYDAFLTCFPSRLVSFGGQMAVGSLQSPLFGLPFQGEGLKEL